MVNFKKIIPYLIILSAFFIQLRYLAELQNSFPDSFGQQPFCGVDAKAHSERAIGLLDGSIPGDVPYYFIPFYPFYLSLFHAFWGDALLLPIYVQTLLQLAGIAALYSLGRLVYASFLAGTLAALGLATYSYYLFYLPCFDQSLLTVPFLTLTTFFVLKFHQRQKSGWLMLAGISFAATAFSRPTVLVLFPVVVGWLYFDFRHHRNKVAISTVSTTPTWGSFVRNVIFLTLPFVIIVTPITWHNYQVSGQFILISDNFGVNLFTGNNPDATGLDSLANVQGQPAELRFRETVIREERGETTLTAEAVRYIIQQPGDWLALVATKTWLWFGETDERLVSPFFPLMVSQSRTLASLPLEWRAAMITALLGLVMIPGKSRRQLLLWLVYGTFSLVTIAFFIQLRFRLPFAPFVFLVAAALLAAASRLKWQFPYRFWATLLVMLFLCPIVPGLWLFILLFAGLGLWPKAPLPNKTRDIRSYLLRLSTICIYLLVVGLWVRAEALASGASQSIDHYLGPPLGAQGVLGQTFQVDCDGLNRIDLTLGVFNAQHDQPVTFHLASDVSAQETLYSETFAGSEVTDYQQKSFYFSPIADSAGRTFFFFISSPTSTPQNAITIRGYTDTPLDRYPDGRAFAGKLDSLQQIEADIAFGAYCEMSLSEKLWAVVKQFIPVSLIANHSVYKYRWFVTDCVAYR